MPQHSRYPRQICEIRLCCLFNLDSNILVINIQVDSPNLALMDGNIDITVAIVAKVIFEGNLSCSLNLQELLVQVLKGENGVSVELRIEVQ
jgi:hypothetical protein